MCLPECYCPRRFSYTDPPLTSGRVKMIWRTPSRTLIKYTLLDWKPFTWHPDNDTERLYLSFPQSGISVKRLILSFRSPSFVVSCCVVYVCARVCVSLCLILRIFFTNQGPYPVFVIFNIKIKKKENIRHFLSNSLIMFNFLWFFCPVDTLYTRT